MAASRGFPTDGSRVSNVLGHIADDLRTIASDELELTRNRLAQHFETLVAKASVALLGTIVGLIGLGMLCAVAVAALAPILPPLWLRLLIMAIVYVAIGGAVAAYYSKKIAKTGATPSLDVPVRELEDTVDAVRRGLR